MVFPSNPPPSDPFAPTPPPGGPYGPGPIGPGPTGPSQFGPGPFQPAPASGNSAWKYILIGCLAIIVLGGVVTIGSCLYLASKGGTAITGVMKMAKPQVMSQLTSDHTPEQRARFEQAYDQYAEGSQKLGITEWATKYEAATNQLSTINTDSQVTVEESQAWADLVLDGVAPEGAGEGTGDAGAADGGTAPTGDAGAADAPAADAPADDNGGGLEGGKGN